MLEDENNPKNLLFPKTRIKNMESILPRRVPNIQISALDGPDFISGTYGGSITLKI